jgi:hypothetical protein
MTTKSFYRWYLHISFESGVVFINGEYCEIPVSKDYTHLVKSQDFSFGNYSNLFEAQSSELYASSSSEIKQHMFEEVWDTITEDYKKSQDRRLIELLQKLIKVYINLK